MHKELISIGLGILVAIIPILLPNLSAIFGYGLFGVAAILVLAGAGGFVRQARRLHAKTREITIFHVTIRK